MSTNSSKAAATAAQVPLNLRRTGAQPTRDVEQARQAFLIRRLRLTASLAAAIAPIAFGEGRLS